MKKKIFSTLLAIAMLLSMVLLCCGCGAKDAGADDASAARIAELEAENAALKAQLAELTATPTAIAQTATLKDWTMEASAWSDSNGATVSFTATPDSYVDGMRAALSVRMGELEAESTNCNWDGKAFVGSVELSAADGYSYHCVLTNPDGTQEEALLNGPTNIVDETLVNLGSSLSAYANFVVEDWASTEDSLTIKSGYMQAQMPQLTFNNTTHTLSAAALVLKLNDQEVSRQDVTLDAGEGSGSYEATIDGITFSMPAMEEDHQLDLWLEVTLDSGNTVAISGGSWYSSDNELQLVVG